MQFPGTTRNAIAMGLIGAAAIGLPAIAQADHHEQRDTSETLSRDVEQFNKTGGSLDVRSDASGETPSSEMNGKADTSTNAADRETADALSKDVDSYNRSGGSLNADTAADSDLADDTRATGERRSHRKADELSEDIEEYNKNAR